MSETDKVARKPMSAEAFTKMIPEEERAGLHADLDMVLDVVVEVQAGADSKTLKVIDLERLIDSGGRALGLHFQFAVMQKMLETQTHLQFAADPTAATKALLIAEKLITRDEGLPEGTRLAPGSGRVN